MRSCVVYESQFGNTAEVARAIGRGLGDCVVLEVGEVERGGLDHLDLVVLGGPTHAFSMSRAATRRSAEEQGAPRGHAERGVREVLAELPPTLPPAVATFDTKIAKARRWPGSAARAAARQLRRRHARVVASESFYVADTAGPLIDGELDRAEAWGRSLLQRAAA